MAYFKKLVGERCYLSPIDPDDAPAFAEWVNDTEVAAGVTLTASASSCPSCTWRRSR